MNNAVWKDTVKLPSFEKMEGDIKTNVLIIGGGLCGLLCAYRLQASGIECVVAERNQIASGVSGHTTAKITSQHGLIYTKLLQKRGRDAAQKYLYANENAILEYEKLAKKCGFEKRDAFTYSLSDRKKIEEEVKTVNSLGFAAEFAENTELPFPVRGAIRFKNQAQCNPLRFIAEMVSNLSVYENTEVLELMPGCAVTSSGKIHFKSCIITTHFPFINKHGAYFINLYQHRSYVIAAKNTPHFAGMYVDESNDGLSFRSHAEYLLIGGGGHRTGKKGRAWQDGFDVLEKYYPEAKVSYTWATQDCMTLDGFPYIGPYGKNTADLFVATGFNKWGMTSSMAAAGILCDLVQGKKNELADFFSPTRSLQHPQLYVNLFSSVTNLLNPIKPRCPHMGCSLKWNKNERSWDCPCHGSRFSENGNMLNNPATGNLKKAPKRKK